jgi:hypothetical protein
MAHGVLFLLGLCVVSCAPYPAFAQQRLASTELITNAKQYDGKTVVYAGEVIGDIMVRGEHAWINLNDGDNAIGIWTDKRALKDIAYTGSYRSKGDWVQITGTFHRACLQHGGDLDIHAQAVRKISTGRFAFESLSRGKITAAAMLLGALCLALILRQLKSK